MSNYSNINIHWDKWAEEHPAIVNKKRKIILRQGQSPGDILTMSRAIADLKASYPNYQIDIRCPAMEVWKNSPHLTPLKEDDPEVETFNIGYPLINESGWRGLHFSDAFRYDMEEKLGVPIKKTGIRPELWISEEEKSWYNQVHCEFGWDGPYWILNAGHKSDNVLKQYPRWQEVVDLLNKYFQGKVKVVTIGHQDHIHPKLNGVLDLVGKTNTRELIRLMYWAHGSVGPISFQFVISAAFGQPAVVVAGNKEGLRWQAYNWIRYICNTGCFPEFQWDGCWKGGQGKKCPNLVETDKGLVPKCFEMIKPEEVTKAVTDYYEGGRLKLPSDEENYKFQKAFKHFQKSQKRR